MSAMHQFMFPSVKFDRGGMYLDRRITHHIVKNNLTADCYAQEINEEYVTETRDLIDGGGEFLVPG